MTADTHVAMVSLSGDRTSFAVHRWLQSAAARDDQVRPALAAVAYNHEAGVACDGNRLHVASIQAAPVVTSPCAVPPKDGYLLVSNRGIDGRPLKVPSTDATIQVPLVVGEKYPDIGVAVPCDGDEREVMLSPQFLADALKGMMGGDSVRIRIHDNGKAVELLGYSDENKECPAYALIMPRYLLRHDTECTHYTWRPCGKSLGKPTAQIIQA